MKSSLLGWWPQPGSSCAVSVVSDVSSRKAAHTRSWDNCGQNRVNRLGKSALLLWLLWFERYMLPPWASWTVAKDCMSKEHLYFEHYSFTNWRSQQAWISNCGQNRVKWTQNLHFWMNLNDLKLVLCLRRPLSRQVTSVWWKHMFLEFYTRY